MTASIWGPMGPLIYSLGDHANTRAQAKLKARYLYFYFFLATSTPFTTDSLLSLIDTARRSSQKLLTVSLQLKLTILVVVVAVVGLFVVTLRAVLSVFYSGDLVKSYSSGYCIEWNVNTYDNHNMSDMDISTRVFHFYLTLRKEFKSL